jgi:hypothetical protein
MNSAEQAAGEARVRQLLIEPLEKLGLGRPTGLTIEKFEAMKTELAKKLAYMSALHLAALREVVETHPAGKDKTRFPVAATILGWAGQIQPPGDDASPLIRAVFASRLGQDAIAGGWSPELLEQLRRERRWPVSYTVTQIKRQAETDLRRMQDLDARLARGAAMTPAEAEFRARRQVALDKCARIAALALEGAGA